MENNTKANYALKYGLILTPEQRSEVHRLCVINRKCWNFILAEWRMYDGDWKEDKKVFEETGVKVEKVKNSQRHKEIRAKWNAFLELEGNEWMNTIANKRYYDYITKDFNAAWSKYFGEQKDGTLKRKRAEYLNNYHTKKAVQLAQGNLTIKWREEEFDRLCQPKFKKRGNKGTYSVDSKASPYVDFENGILKLNSKQETPYRFKIKKSDKYFKQQINKVGRITISMGNDGKAFVSFGLARDEKQITRNEKLPIGLDFGSIDYLISNFGLKINKRKTELKRLDVRIKKLQSKANAMYLKNKDNKDWERKNQIKIYRQISKAERKKAQLRSSDTHKVTHLITKYFDLISLEDLNIKGMTKSPKAKVSEDGKSFVRNNTPQKAGLARNILNNNFHETKRQLEYKSKWRGGHFEQVGRYFASSKTMSCCGHKQKMELSDRMVVCDKCGMEHDRDINAAINILTETISKAGVNTPYSKKNAFNFLKESSNHIAINKFVKASLNGENPVIKHRRQKQYVEAILLFIKDLKDSGLCISI